MKCVYVFNPAWDSLRFLDLLVWCPALFWKFTAIISSSFSFAPSSSFWESNYTYASCCCCSVTQLYPTLYSPMDCGSPGFTVLHYLPELAQTHVHWVDDAIQPSHLLSPPSSALKSFPASESFSVTWLFTSGDQSIGALASPSVLPINIQGWFPLGLTSLISLLSKGLSRVFSSTTVRKHQLFGAQPSLWSNSYIRAWLLEKNIVWLDGTFVGKVMSLLFKMLSRLVITFLPRNKRLLISWLQSPSTVVLEPKKIKSITDSIVSPSVCHEVMGLDAMILVFLNVEF